MSEATVQTRGQRLIGASLVAYPAMVASAVLGWVWPFVVFALATFVVEELLPRSAPAIDSLLTRSNAGWELRSMVRSLSLIVVLALRPHMSMATFVATALCIAAFEGAEAWFRVISYHVGSRRKLPILSRNVDLSRLRIPDVRYGAFANLTPERVRALFVLPVLGLLLTAITDEAAYALIGAAAAAGLAIAGIGRITIGALVASRISSGSSVVSAIHRQITTYAPEVALYFSGSAASLYQINMWLGVVSQLDQRVMILLRERRNLADLAPTSLPVVCIPSAIDLMSFDIPSLRVALYPANVGKNIHFLRVPGMAHVFIGHGDSDKIASVNPFSKAYDELWVAGPAGRDRWARAAVGVEDHDIVEVGRPQLAAIKPGARDGQVFTVLYAPTWEGWTNDPQNTSLTLMGPMIIAALLAHPLNVRVIYKPHPFTGTRDSNAAASNAAIIAMIERANLERAAGDFTKLPDAQTREADRELTRLRGEMNAMSISAVSADDATAARDSGKAHPDYPKEAGRLGREWDTVYWASQPEWAHRVVVDSMPALFDTFNHSDVLITDISSVVADYLSSGKPYIVTNSSDLSDSVFRETYPTASAAHLLGSDCEGLADVVSALAGGTDEWREERNKLTSYLLGPQDAAPLDRFRRAMDEVMVKANAMARPQPGEDDDFNQQSDAADE